MANNDINNVTEIWKDIPDYEGLYQISNIGRVKSLKREWRANGALRKHDDIILKPLEDTKGYYQVVLTKNFKEKRFMISRLVAFAFLQKKENKKEVNHMDGNKKNNYYLNLEWVTGSENCLHAIRNGLRNTAKGENQHFAKLTEKEIVDIRISKLTQNELALKYNVHQSTISSIKLKKTWRHIA